MTKFALPALILCILALFSYSVTSQPSGAPADSTELGAGPTQKLADVETVTEDRQQPPAKTIDSVGEELRQLSDESRANSDKIAQTATLRTDLLKLIQETKSSSDKVAQNMLDQINAMRDDQVKSLKDATAAGERTAQALREEVAASQAKLAAKFEDMLKTDTARSEALSQRVDALNKEMQDLKKSMEEDRQNASNISPGFA